MGQPTLDATLSKCLTPLAEGVVLLSTRVSSRVRKAHEESASKHLCEVEFEKHLSIRQT